VGPLQRGLAHARETAGEHRPAKGQAISLSIDNPYIGQQLQRNFNNIRVRSFILTGAPCLQPLKWFVLAAKMCWLPHGYRSAEVSACGVCEAAPELARRSAALLSSVRATPGGMWTGPPGGNRC
jgi:hypothetical protein